MVYMQGWEGGKVVYMHTSRVGLRTQLTSSVACADRSRRRSNSCSLKSLYMDECIGG